MSFSFPPNALYAILLSLLMVGCQEYRFEPLTPSNPHIKRETYKVKAASAVDILFVIDNSGSMVGEQKAIGQSFSKFSSELDKYFGLGMYRIAVITTGIESTECKPCSDNLLGSCTNETGESGRFQYRLGWNVGSDDEPNYLFEEDPTCKIITSENAARCFYQNGKGVVLVGVNGCGYERGLEAMRFALSKPLLDGWNANFLRDDADLVVVVITDEEDCGKVGDVTEGLSGILGNTCYYAAKGSGPTGLTSDPTGRPFALTPARDYYNFLINVKADKQKVKFAAIVGLKDVTSPSQTEITFENNTEENAKVLSACSTNECKGKHCSARPGTRYIELADLFGIGDKSFVDTICKADFSETMQKLGSFVTCPKVLYLSEEIVDEGLVSILVNNVTVPLYSCQDEDKFEVCKGLLDNTCSNNKPCVRTWEYIPRDTNTNSTSGGKIVFADHYDPCVLMGSKDTKIELVYTTK